MDEKHHDLQLQSINLTIHFFLQGGSSFSTVSATEVSDLKKRKKEETELKLSYTTSSWGVSGVSINYWGL